MTPSVFVFAAALLIVANAAKLPSTWKTCKRNLPPAEYEPCINAALKDAVDDLFANGAPTLGIPPMEPIKITALDIGQGNGPVAVDIKFEDVEMYNINSYVITEIRHKDSENYKIGASVVLKKPLLWKSKYQLAGKVLVLPIRGKGKCMFELDNLRASYNLYGSPIKKGEEIYMNVTKLDFFFDTDKLHVKFENLFDGNKELGDNMNVFLNENWDSILKELKPAILQGISQAFQSISSQIFSKIPYKKLFPAK